MKKTTTLLTVALATFFAIACSDNNSSPAVNTNADSNKTAEDTYIPKDQALQDSIIALDSALFHAYNTCDTVSYAAMFSDDFEFYHDGGGLETNKQASVDSYKKYVCGKVTRELLKGSLEVSPVPRYGAVEIGKHRFHNSQEPNAESKYSRFVIVWKREPAGWKITRVISLH